MSKVAKGTVKPSKLTGSEASWSALLAISGLVLIFGVLLWFGASHNGTKERGIEGALISKVVTTSEPASGTKTTSTTEYSDTIVIAVLTIGTALLLCAVFYGRIREIKVEGIDLTLGSDEGDAVDKGVDATVKPSTAPEKAAVSSLAKTVARQRALEALATQPNKLTSEQLEQLGREAAKDLLALSAKPKTNGQGLVQHS